MRTGGLLLLLLLAAPGEVPAAEPATPLEAVLAAHRAVTTAQGTFQLRQGAVEGSAELPFAHRGTAKTEGAVHEGRFALAPPARVDLVLRQAAVDGWRWRLGSDGRVFWDLWLDAPDQEARPRLGAVGSLAHQDAALAALPGLLRLDPVRLADGALRVRTEPAGTDPAQRLVIEAADPAHAGFRQATIGLGGDLRPRSIALVDAAGSELLITLVEVRFDEPLPEGAFTPPR